MKKDLKYIGVVIGEFYKLLERDCPLLSLPMLMVVKEDGKLYLSPVNYSKQKFLSLKQDISSMEDKDCLFSDMCHEHALDLVGALNEEKLDFNIYY